MTALRWSGGYGYDEGGGILASLAYYGSPVAGWAVFVVQERLPGGPWATEAEAMAAAEAFAAEVAPGPLTVEGLEDLRRQVREVDRRYDY